MIYIKLTFSIIIFFSLSLRASDVKIIELHVNKSLDQLVLETEVNNEEIQNNSEISDNTSKDNLSKKASDEDIPIDNNIVNSEKEVINLDSETIFEINNNIIENHLKSINVIKSKTLYREFIKILSDIDFEDESFDNEKSFFIIQKLYEIGEIEKAYKLIKKINLENINNKTHLEFLYLIELNYLYSSYKLVEVCELKSDLLEKSFMLSDNLLQKTDIFCLTLENKLSEAKLLNSLLLDSEKEDDEIFQRLLSYMFLKDKTNNSSSLLGNIKSKELIFLYSAMLRINELPLDEDFIKVDPLNLSIPVILSESTEMEIRIKAAHSAYYEDLFSINSLSALYQSVDFNSKQFNDPKKTISNLKSKELIMAYYYQLANIQIFPDERLEVVRQYWDFAKQSGLEKIAYIITDQIIESFSPTISNNHIALEIAFANISNGNYEEALKWINLYEISNSSSEITNYAKFLINVNQSEEMSTIINYLSENYKDFDNINNQLSLESLRVLINFLKIKNFPSQELLYEKISDERLMPSYFLTQDIIFHINEKNNLSVFLLCLISMQNKSWIEIHPVHLKLILESINLYENGSLQKKIILEILNELKIF